MSTPDLVIQKPLRENTGRTSPEKKALAAHLRDRHGRLIELSYVQVEELRDLHVVIDETCSWKVA